MFCLATFRRAMLYSILLLLLGSIIACDTDNSQISVYANVEIFYPGAPMLQLEELSNDGNTYHFMVVADEPVPYDTEVYVEDTIEGTFESGGDSVILSRMFPDGKLPIPAQHFLTIRQGRTVVAGSGSFSMGGRGQYTTDSPEPLKVKMRDMKTTLTLMPWNMDGDSPYNVVGKSTIVFEQK